MSDLDDLYHDVILDHGTRPRHRGTLAQPTCSAEGDNPLCGDRVTVMIQLDDAQEDIEDVAFDGEGCAICMASASMMAEAIKGRTRTDVEALFGAFHDALTGTDDVDLETLGSLAALQGVRKYPMRVKCATLPWHALRAALSGDGA